MQPVSQLHRVAREYAKAGIPVFPCLPDAKEPATPNGFHDATTDLAQIDSWWQECSGYNLAFSPGSVGQCVVDIDGEIGEANWEALLAQEGLSEPATRVIRTPRGGRHLYFAGDLPSSASKLGEKIDTRGATGYVLVPPSIVGGKPYVLETDHEIQTTPTFCETALAKSKQAVHAAPTTIDKAAAYERARAALSNQLREAGGRIGEGKRNDLGFAVACKCRDAGLDELETEAFVLEQWNSHCEPPLELEEIKLFIWSAFSGNAQNKEAGVYAVAPAAETFGAALDKLPPPKPQERSRFYPKNETEQENTPAPRWLLNRLIQEKTTVLMVGATQSYKSFLALDIAIALSAGVETFGSTADLGPVFYAALEGRSNIEGARRRAWKLGRNFMEPLENFFVMRAPMVADEAECQEFGEQVAARCIGKMPRLIVLDTVAKCMTGLNENDVRDVGRFTRFCDSLVEHLGCTVLAIHHLGKDSTRGSRGSSALDANFDSILTVKAHAATKAVEVWVKKHKDAEEPTTPWTFQAKPFAQSLCFYPTTQAEHEALVRSEDLLDKHSVGAALLKLGAKGDEKAVSTTVLARQLYPAVENESAEAHETAVAALARQLGRLAKTKLRAYTLPGANGSVWALP